MAQTPVINWQPYFQQVRSAGKSLTLDAALKAMKTPSKKSPPRLAIDIGCGEGRDTMELLRAGWRVNAIDSDAQGCQALRNSAATEGLDTALTVQETTYDQAFYPKAQFDLVNAYLALPYCDPSLFSAVWNSAVNALKIDGILACNLFGDKHTWASVPFVSSFKRSQVDTMLKPFTIITLNETSANATAASGQTITNHEYFIIAKKK